MTVSVTLQPDNLNNYLAEWIPTTILTSIQARMDINGYRGASIIKFSVAWGIDIPSGAVIHSATIALYYESWYNASGWINPQGRPCRLYRVLRSDLNEAYCCWNNYKQSTAWGTGGCLNSSTDYTSTDAADVTMPSSYGWVSWDVTNQVKTAQLNSIDVKCKLIDVGSASNKTTYSFKSRSDADPSLRPKLIIEYSTIPTVVTQEATQIGASQALGNGNVTSDGGADITERGICYCLKAEGTPDLTDKKVTASGTTGAFSAGLTGLSKLTEYNTRAYAVNANGTAYGELISFMTADIDQEWVALATEEYVDNHAVTKIRVANAPPDNPAEGDVYIDSVTNGMYIATD